MYTLLFRSVLTRLDAETVHRLTVRALTILSGSRMLLALIRRLPTASRSIAFRPAALRTSSLGLTFPSPVGLAAGFDKDAQVYRALDLFGFGYVEVGTVTAEPQPGNQAPRMFRLPADRALVNRMGFNNNGSAAAARLLRRPRHGQIVGVNIGRTKRADDPVADYQISTRRLAPLADYLVVNVSSPNTPGLRDLQAVDTLRPLLAAVLEAAGPRRPPVLVKIAPDLADEDVDAIADLAVELGLDGIIATNTTISRDGLLTPAGTVASIGAGGLSGAPVRDRSLAILSRLSARVGHQLTLISVGGIEDAGDVWNRLAAGASLVQTYTGLVYHGPFFVRNLNRALASRLQASEFNSINDLVGSASRR